MSRTFLRSLLVPGLVFVASYIGLVTVYLLFGTAITAATGAVLVYLSFGAIVWMVRNP